MKITPATFTALVLIGGLIGVFSPYLDRHAFESARRQRAEHALRDDSARGKATRFALGAASGAVIGLVVFLQKKREGE